MKSVNDYNFDLMLILIKNIEKDTRQLGKLIDEVTLTPAQEAELKKQLGGDR